MKNFIFSLLVFCGSCFSQIEKLPDLDPNNDVDPNTVLNPSIETDFTVFPNYQDYVLEEEKEKPTTEFIFGRARYENVKGNTGWDTDYPDSDENFLRGVERYTTLDVNTESYYPLDLTSDNLFEVTFLYMNLKRTPTTKANFGINLTEEEGKNLKEWMLRGGFLMVDDFWGDLHWDEFLVEFTKIFPDRKLIKINTDDPIFRTLFDVDYIEQIPGRSVTWDYASGFDLDDPDYPPSVHVVLDDYGRIMMVVNHNTDFGDGWEHTFYEEYPTKYINYAYKVGTNYIIYSLSH